MRESQYGRTLTSMLPFRNFASGVLFGMLVLEGWVLGLKFAGFDLVDITPDP